MRIFPAGVVIFALLGAIHVGRAAERVNFSRDVRPILSDRCFPCHGPDATNQKSSFRLDTKENIFAKLGDHYAVVPGNLEASTLHRRIRSESLFTIMPPADSGLSLTEEEKDILDAWILQGAPYAKHWSFTPLERPAPPSVENGDWVRNPIDRFVLAKLEGKGITPSPEADRRTLIRRLSFDLRGLPPTPAEIAVFLNDGSAEAYENLVDRLLASPHYGERMAIYWLDLARYADTKGYHGDNPRPVWLYRDYVINAFNENKPFDQFVIEQLAGDLLPDATRWQKIASGYNRLLQTTQEGGAQAEEYRAIYQADRVRNTATAFLGITMGCAQCHDHKFDPITQKDFYSFGAFFADVKEVAVGVQPRTKMPTAAQQAELDRLAGQIAELEKRLNQRRPELTAAQAKNDVPSEVAAILTIAAKKRDDEQKQKLSAYYREIAPELEPLRKQLAQARERHKQLLDSVPETLITVALEDPRTVRLLPRGNWMNDSGPIMTPAIPEVFGKLDTGGRRATRLDLARWMVSSENPLTSRAMVNRFWMLMFGQGIARTPADLGSQGDWPTHPKLLDWLAAEFIASGWDVKQLLKTIVMSSTYRQSSVIRPELAERDPYNRLLARQGRFRLPAEMVRDNVLAISGLLVETVGGPSARPYQPAGYYKALNFPKREYEADTGAKQYRRGVYTHWQRTFLHPMLKAFDAPSREECTAQRPRSNTPLQSLVLLNDPTFVEASRVFAERIIREGGSSPEDKIRFAYAWALGRRPGEAEVNTLLSLYKKHLGQYKADSEAAKKLIAVGLSPVPDDIPAAKLAAWTSVARTIFCLNETITRP